MLNGPEREWSKQPRNDINVTMGMMAITDSPKPEHLEDIVDRQRTSKYLRTWRSVWWILRWRKSTKNTQTLLTLEECRGAKSIILKEVQKKFFWEELKALESGQPVHQQSSLLSLHPFVEDGLIRMWGRLQQVKATFEELHPVLVKTCGVINQLVLYIHAQLQHARTGTVISTLRRQDIWILRSKKTVSSVIRKCLECGRFLAGPAFEQTLPFPRCRVTCRRSFEATGMDLGGPLYLK